MCRSGESMWDRGTEYREQVRGGKVCGEEVEGCGRVGGMWVGG